MNQRRRWSLGVTGLALAACVEPDPDRYVPPGALPTPGVVELAIDGGGRVELEPGSGIGVGVAYTEGGRWAVTTACDTLLSGASCDYDLVVSTDESSPIADFAAVDLEANDGLSSIDDFALAAELSTETDTDGFGFTTSPGATVRVSALLDDPGFDSRFDWSDDPRFISWVGDGAVHRGAPTNPVDLRPNRP